MTIRHSCFRAVAFMKSSSRAAGAILLLLVAGLQVSVLGDEKTLQSQLDALSSMREAGIEIELKPLDRVVEQYKLTLQQLKSSAQNAGDLDLVVAVDNALKNLSQETAFKPLSENPKVARIQQTHQKVRDDLKKQLEGRLLAIDRDYSIQLEALVKELTQAGKTDEALKVREIRDRFIADFQASKIASPGEVREFEIVDGVKMQMVWIPPGDFVMGSKKGDPGYLDGDARHPVTLTKGFWLGKYEVTQGQWQAVMGSNPSNFKGKDHPVEKVSWNDISNSGGFLEKVNRKAPSGLRFRLPTEAQWEYACLGGEKAFKTSPKGGVANLDQVAWHVKNSDSTTHPVGQKMANGWGLHDMLGNVWEWTADRKRLYSAAPMTDPDGAATGSERILKGGTWNGDQTHCQAIFRGSTNQTESGYSVGFRLALSSFP